MWSKGKYSHMDEFVQESAEFGFSHVELSSILTPDKLNELLGVKGLNVSSIHAPCPCVGIHQGLNEAAFSLSSLSEDARKKALEFTKATIELASKLNVDIVIIHAGRTDLNFSMEDELHQLYNMGRANSAEYGEIKEKLIASRSFWACPHVDAAKASLRELAALASEKKVTLGIENRLYSYEIPNFDEMIGFLDELPSETVGYWYDSGHAEIQSRLGFCSHEEWIAGLSEKIIGAHLHDVRGIKDHYAPGSGDMDWNLIAAHLPKDALKVCEIGEWNKPEDIRQVVSFLQGKGII